MVKINAKEVLKAELRKRNETHEPYILVLETQTGKWYFDKRENIINLEPLPTIHILGNHLIDMLYYKSIKCITKIDKEHIYNWIMQVIEEQDW